MDKSVLVITPWKRRWELGNSAGVSDDHYFVKGLAERGYVVHFLCPRDTTSDEIEARYAVHRFPNVLEASEHVPSIIRRPLWVFLYTFCVVFYGTRVCRRIRPSIVIGHTQLGSFGVRLLAKRLRIPSIMKLFGVVDLDRTDWSPLRYWRKNVEQILAFKVHHDAWIILDDGTGGDTAARRHGVPSNRIHLLPNGVNTEWAAGPSGAANRYGIPPGTRVVLYLSRITAWKRPDLFIRLAPRVLQLTDHPIVFVLAGDGPFRRSCEALVASLSLESQVRFLGPVPHDEIPQLMSITSVLASTNRRSNRGVPPCEAMICGVPVVAFDAGDTGSVVREGVNGRLIRDGDETAFARAVADLLNDEKAREEMGRRAREFALKNFTGWPARVAMEADLIERVIAQHASRGIARNHTGTL
jgi:glycosyltransferase involved in cell wall biosynthesis